MPRYPVYIVSKGRADTRLTAKALDKIGVPFQIVVEPQEYEAYAAAVGADRVLQLPFSNLGQGSIPARNWIWEHAKKSGAARHWILDDNISGFRRFNRGQRLRVSDGSIFAEAESFVDRYKNVPMAGFQYSMFAITEVTRAITKPFLANTRIYSCILLSNETSHRWRGRYNEDTDLSLRLLKDGFCTILFYAFLCDKQGTMQMKGGNTDELYKQNEAFDGRLAMARSLQSQHPDVTTVIRKWGRWQHNVDYRPFKSNKLIRNKEASPD